MKLGSSFSSFIECNKCNGIWRVGTTAICEGVKNLTLIVISVL